MGAKYSIFHLCSLKRFDWIFEKPSTSASVRGAVNSVQVSLVMLE